MAFLTALWDSTKKDLKRAEPLVAQINALKVWLVQPTNS